MLGESEPSRGPVRTADLDNESQVCLSLDPRIQLSGDLDSSAVEKIVSEMARGVLEDAAREQELVVDMSNVRWVYPTGVVGVLTLLRYMTARLRWTDISSFGKARVLLPTWHDEESFPAGFLDHIGFINHCERMHVDTNKTDIPTLKEGESHRSVPRRYLDLKRVESGTGVDANVRDDFLADICGGVLVKFREWLAAKSLLLDEPEAVIGAATALQELVMNVFDHSSCGGFAYAQKGVRNYRAHLAVVVADAGPGIPHSIQELATAMDNPGIKPGEAIRLASEKGATSKPRKLRDGLYGGGVGLSTLREVADDTKGVLYIRSGLGYAKYRRGNMTVNTGDLEEFPGTFVSLYVPISGKRGTQRARHR